MRITRTPLRKRIFLALATLPFLGVVAAFGIAPDTATENLARETVVETLAPPTVESVDRVFSISGERNASAVVKPCRGCCNAWASVPRNARLSLLQFAAAMPSPA